MSSRFSWRLVVKPANKMGTDLGCSCIAAARVARTHATAQQKLMWEALREAVDEEMEADPRVCMMGEISLHQHVWTTYMPTIICIPPFCKCYCITCEERLFRLGPITWRTYLKQ